MPHFYSKFYKNSTLKTAIKSSRVFQELNPSGISAGKATQTRVPAMLLFLSQEIKKSTIRVFSSVITFVPSFVNLGHLFKSRLAEHAHIYTENNDLCVLLEGKFAKKYIIKRLTSIFMVYFCHES
jgi:hypothetical protein